MKVILNKDIPNLGEEGDIKDVARGYARNYLIPNQLVMPYTRDALAILESRREQLANRREEKRKAALDIKTRLETEELVLDMPAGERGRLFGSVTSANIADALAARGITVERKRIDIPEKTIKTVGTVRVRVRLYGEEEAELKVIVNAAGGKGAASAEAVPSEAPDTAGDTQGEKEPAAETVVENEAASVEQDAAADAPADAPASESPSSPAAAEPESGEEESSTDAAEDAAIETEDDSEKE
jgi:large subunit ribosomal protein L9